MPPNPTADQGAANADDGDGLGLSAAALFAIVWDTLAEVLGTAAVAAIVRRAAWGASAHSAELAELAIVRDDLEYRYTLLAAWSQQAERGRHALRALVVHLGRLLLELTGTVVIGELERIPELRAGGLVWRGEEAN